MTGLAIGNVSDWLTRNVDGLRRMHHERERRHGDPYLNIFGVKVFSSAEKTYLSIRLLLAGDCWQF